MAASEQSSYSPFSTPSKYDGPLQNVPLAPKDQMFGLKAAYLADASPHKVDLGPGAYRDDKARPWVLPVVKKADGLLRQDPNLDHEYLPIAGLKEYLTASQALVLGKDSPAINAGRVVSIQTLSGTGALSLGARFLSSFYPDTSAKRVYVSSPPYVNHLPILRDAALETGLYPYYSAATRNLDFERLLDTLRRIPEHSIILLHACAHNPTGVDPTRSQWRQIAQTMKEQNHLPFFDTAYQGFASGSLDDDAWAIRHFVEEAGFDTIFIAQSYAKNFGLYGERAGCLHVIAPNPSLAANIQSQLELLQRVSISTPPLYGARIASTILNNPQFFEEWKDDLRTMSGRIKEMRAALRKELGGTGWRHLTEQIGMFCYTGLSAEQAKVLREVWHIYMTSDGRISVSGLNRGNVGYVARAIREVTKGAKL